MSSLGPDW